MPTHKIEIVFITVTDRVAITMRHIHRPDLTPTSTKVNWVLMARQPAAVTYVSSDSQEIRMHSSRMDTVRCGGGGGEGLCPWGCRPGATE